MKNRSTYFLAVFLLIAGLLVMTMDANAGINTKAAKKTYSSCADDVDLGNKPYKVGTTKAQPVGQLPEVYKDVCLSDAKLKEYYCSGRNPVNAEVSCRGGCAKGQCRPDPVCGNRVVEFGETCDVGDAIDHDGCSASCRYEGTFLKMYHNLTESNPTTVIDVGDNHNDGDIVRGHGLPTGLRRGHYYVSIDQDNDDPGASDYVQVSDSDSLEPIDEITISLWVYPLTHLFDRNQNYVLISKADNLHGYQLWYSSEEGVLYFSAQGSDRVRNKSITSLPNVLRNNMWQNVVVTYKANNGGKIYINHHDVTASSMDDELASRWDEPLVIGAESEDKSNAFKGGITDVAIYPFRITDEGAIKKLSLFHGWRLLPWGSCGNGTIESTERCDDGNAYGGDGCSALCMYEGDVWNFNESDSRSYSTPSEVHEMNNIENDGVMMGSVSKVAGRGGASDTALSLDGAGDYIDIPSSPTLNPSDEITLSLWIKPNFDAEREYVLISKLDTYGGYELRYDNRPSGKEFSLNVAHGNQAIVSEAGINLENGQWYHVLATYRFGDGGSGKIYLDKDDVTDQSFSKNFGNRPRGNLIFGAKSADKTMPFRGGIDDVFIGQFLVNETQVRKIYDNGSLND